MGYKQLLSLASMPMPTAARTQTQGTAKMAYSILGVILGIILGII